MAVVERPHSEQNSPIFNAVLTTAALVVVVAGIMAARVIIIPFLLAIFIAVILSAILSWLRERNIKTGLAVSIMILLLAVMGLSMVLVVGASVNELIRKLPQISTALQLQEQKLSRWMEEHGFSLERNQENDNTPQSLEINVPGLMPAPDRPEGEESSEPQGNAEAAPRENGQEAQPTVTPPAELEQQTGGAAAGAATPPTEATAPAEAAAQMEPRANPAEGAGESLTEAVESAEEAAPPGQTPGVAPVEPAPEAAPLPDGGRVTGTGAQQPPFEAPTRFEMLFPDYIFGPQKHVVEFLPSTTTQPRSTYGLLGAYSPIEIFRSFLDSVMGMVNYALIVFLMLMFLLLEWSRFGQKLEKLPGNTQSYVEQVAEILASIRRYMFIKTLVSLLTGLLITGWLLMLGASYAVLWGTVAFLFNYIPTIGSIIAGIVPTLFVLVDQGPVEAMWVAVAFLVVNFLIGNILEPRIMGEGLGLSTFVVFLSLVFWGFVLGPVGMLLAVPLTMAIKIALGRDERTQWIALLLGSATTLDEDSEQETIVA